MHFDDSPSSGVIPIPYDKLSSDALDGVIEEFVTREGTDYGDYDYSLSDKKQHILQQLQKGKATVLFDPDTGTCHIQLSDLVQRHGL